MREPFPKEGSVRDRLRGLHLYPRRRYAQHFLTSGHIMERIVEEAGVGPGDVVLEIGCGLGDLTDRIAQRAQFLLGIEVDQRFVEVLRERFRGRENVEIRHGDIMEMDLEGMLKGLGGRVKVLGNLPYNLATQILLRFVNLTDSTILLSFMLQREMAERIMARPATAPYGGITLLIQLRWDIKGVIRVPPDAFYPPPKVESMVVLLTPLPAPKAEVGDEEVFRGLVKAAFGQRRKTLRNALTSWAPLGQRPTLLKEALKETAIDGGRRGETLSLEEFAALSFFLTKRLKGEEGLL